MKYAGRRRIVFRGGPWTLISRIFSWSEKFSVSSQNVYSVKGRKM